MIYFTLLNSKEKTEFIISDMIKQCGEDIHISKIIVLHIYQSINAHL